MSKPILGYWDIRGLAEPIRLLFEYLGTEYEDKRYVCSDGPPYDISSWLDVKHKLGLDFPNLPYLIDGDTMLSESWAILKYVARKYGLGPAEENKHLCDMTEGVVGDVRKSFVSICYGNYDMEADKFFENLPLKLNLFDKYLGTHTWLGGDALSYVDFAFCEILAHFQLARASVLEKHDNVKKYLENFESLEKIAAYRKSDRFKQFPVNNKMAKWGSKAPEC